MVLAGVVTLLAGCAGQPQYQMVKPSATQEEVVQDDAHCRMLSSNVQVADYEYRGTFMEGANILHKQNQTYQLCMTSRGYSAVRMK
ncbi:hypothetical protein E8E75_24000 [Pseudomonas sp. BN606]|nr:hypothetical protein [Pseudomonas sp. BN606]